MIPRVIKYRPTMKSANRSKSSKTSNRGIHYSAVDMSHNYTIINSSINGERCII